MMKTNQNNHIMNMNKGMKQKLSMLLIACLLFTGYRGLTIPGRAEQGNTEQNNAISVSGTQVKVQLLGEDLRRAAKEAIEKGERVDDSVLKGYSKDEELQKSYAGIFSLDKEVYEIPLDSISEGLSESLAEEEAGLQVFVERDAQDLDNLVRKESKESLLLYDGKSQLEQLFPKGEETESVKKEEEENLASDSNLVRNTELTGSELITFLYKNKADHRITFQLSVDGNKYPKVTVSPKTQLFKELVDKLKKEEKKVPVETAKVPESKIEESTEAKGAALEEQLAESVTSSEEVKETAKQAASKEETTVSSVTEARTEDSASKVSIVSEEKKEETSEAVVKAEEKNEESAEAETATEAPVKKESTKEVEVKFSGFLQDVISHYEEFLGELVSARFSQYSLNELGRKSQNVEIEGFATVEVFYEEAAFDREVVLEAKRLFKPEEEAEGEKLSEEQVKVLKEHSIYNDGVSLDIRFVDKKDPSVEVEPLSPVGVRITLEKKALPEDASSDSISIHHLVENNSTKEIEKVDTVVQSNNSKKLILTDDITNTDEVEKSTSTLKTEDDTKDETITKEFTVDSFSLYQITWKTWLGYPFCEYAEVPIRFHYVDRNFNEIGPTVRVTETLGDGINLSRDNNQTFVDSYGRTFNYGNHEKWRWYVDKTPGNRVYFDSSNGGSGIAMKQFNGYKFLNVYPYNKSRDNLDRIVNGHIDDYFDINYKYGPGDGDFRQGLQRIDNTGFTMAIQNNYRQPWIMKDRGEDTFRLCDTHDFYFVYDTKKNETKKRTEEDIETRQDKYIKDNQDGTYDLTLSAQVKKKTKPENLDIVFLVDTSKTMKMSFGTRNNIIGDIPSDKLAPAGASRKELVQEYLSQMVTSLSKNSNYNLRFGLVGFGGSKTDNGATISDTAFNDVTYVGGYTSSASEFNNMLANLPESEGGQTGPNYTAAIMGARRLIDDSYIGNFGGAEHVTSSSVGHDTNKIIVLIADNDPVYSYVLENGVYDETRKTSGGLSDFTASLQKGYSYGNGVDFSRVALNQARGFLSNFNSNSYTAFYTIGIGNKDNWKHLKELTQAHGPSEFTGDDHRRWEVVPDTNHGKFIRAESALLKGADSKIFDGSTPESLKSSIIELGQKIARNQVQNVEISDTLTRFVQPVDTQNPKSTVVGQLVKLKDNGVEVDHEVTDPQEKESLNFKGFDIKVNDDYIENGKKLWRISLKTIPEDFTLPAGYEIRAVAKIIPTVDAFEEIGKTFYNGEYHVAPKSLDPHGTENIIIGDARTDLNAIYKEDLNREQSDKLRYASSTGQPGLPTNTEATLSYKVNGKDENKKYNKPIINPGNMVIEKAFLGFDEGEFFKESSGLTILGEEILKTISFRISRENAAGTEELLTTVSPADYLGENEDKILKLPNTNLYIKVSRVFKEYRSGAPYARAKGNPNISISIYNTPLNMKYRVKEVESSQGKIFSTGTKGYQFDDKAVRHGGQTEDLKLMDVRRNYHFFNTYKNVPREKTITIRKVVEEFGGTAFTTEARNKSFEFYVGLFKYDGNKYIPLSDGDINKYIDNKWKPNNNGRSGHGEVGNIKGNPIEFDDGRGNKINATVVRMKLKHGESLTLPIDENIYYKVFESREDGYDLAKGEISKDGVSETLDIREIKYDFIDFMDGKYINRKGAYSATDFLSRDGEITFRNPRKTLVPTGLQGDFTPYVLSLCGFTFMAGLYLSIKKKKREEV